MRRVLFAFFAAVCVVRSAYAAQAEQPFEKILTLDQSLELAERNNQTLLAAANDMRIAEQRIRESLSRFFPQVGLNMNASQYLAENDYVLPAEFGNTLLTRTGESVEDTFYSARVWLQQPLYTGGRLRNNLLLARADLERSRIKFEDIRGRVALDVSRAFYDLLLARRDIELYENALKQVGRLADQTSRGGTLVRLESLQSRLRRTLSEKKREEQSAYLKYLDALGVELYTRVDVKGELETRPVTLEMAKLLAWAQESRSEIRQTDFQKEIDRLAVNLSQAERYPVIALGAGYEMNDRRFPIDSKQWNATLNVSLPVFDGFSSHAKIRQRRLQANFSRIQRTDLEDRINLEVRESFGELEHWQNEIETRRSELARAEEAAEALARSGTLLDRAEAEEWRVQTAEAYWEAVHRHRVALARLEKAVGKPIRE